MITGAGAVERESVCARLVQLELKWVRKWGRNGVVCGGDFETDFVRRREIECWRQIFQLTIIFTFLSNY